MDDIIGITPSLNAELALRAYRAGIFPMAHPEEGLVTWHQPDPRAILPLDGAHVPRRLARTLRSQTFTMSRDRAFAEVVRGCAADRPVWISEEFQSVYGELHRRGWAHSVEVWQDGHLVGGLYGVHLGGAFFAESKFHVARDASKAALVHLTAHLRERGFGLLDVQYWTPHLGQFGVIEISHRRYLARLRQALARDCAF
ncbi:MAG: leucyl/phenylalanyl-tRNA--protein transferase [Vicinamibacteria bacterium]|jgi:leucyl/phenylalanyl-tRNA--protein transferase|nr:leucyl/phenylalanyl-tRNA--protein transferase [Vicinamibacteria bacterium]